MVAKLVGAFPLVLLTCDSDSELHKDAGLTDIENVHSTSNSDSDINIMEGQIDSDDAQNAKVLQMVGVPSGKRVYSSDEGEGTVKKPRKDV